MLNRWLILILLLVSADTIFAIIPESLEAVATIPIPAMITHIDSETNRDLTIIKVSMKGTTPRKQPELENMGEYLQLNLPNTSVLEPGKFYDSTSPYVPKVGVFQTKDHQAIVRIFLAHTIKDLNTSVEVQVLEDKISILFNHHTLLTSSSSTIGQPNHKPVPDKETGSYQLGMSNYLQKLALYSGALLFILLLILLFRKTYGSKLRAATNDGSMAILSKLPVNPKQNLILLDILNEKLLLCISHDQVQLIAKFPHKMTPPQLEDSMNPRVYLEPQTPLAIPVAPSAKTEKDVKNNAMSQENREKFLSQLKETMKNKSAAKTAAEFTEPKAAAAPPPNKQTDQLHH